jgi:uncharacterized protein (DUF302 family)
MEAEGLITNRCRVSVKETMDHLEANLRAMGLTIFARIDHAKAAADIGQALRPTEVLIFGSAKGGTPLMQINQTIGIDLPLKALAWEDSAGRAWLSYNDPEWLAHRHGIGPAAAQALSALKILLKTTTEKAAQAI